MTHGVPTGFVACRQRLLRRIEASYDFTQTDAAGKMSRGMGAVADGSWWFAQFPSRAGIERSVFLAKSESDRRADAGQRRNATDVPEPRDLMAASKGIDMRQGRICRCA